MVEEARELVQASLQFVAYKGIDTIVSKLMFERELTELDTHSARTLMRSAERHSTGTRKDRAEVGGPEALGGIASTQN